MTKLTDSLVYDLKKKKGEKPLDDDIKDMLDGSSIPFDLIWIQILKRKKTKPTIYWLKSNIIYLPVHLPRKYMTNVYYIIYISDANARYNMKLFCVGTLYTITKLCTGTFWKISDEERRQC